MHTALSLVTTLVLVAAAGSAEPPRRDIVETAVEAGSFKTLAAALEAADLIEALKGDGPFTVLAPTDEAFSKLPPGTVENLLKPENRQQLANILTFHVIPGAATGDQIVKLDNAKTLNGQRVDIRFSNARLQVNQASVVATDIQCSNGVIHVIDQVILPATDNIPTVAANANSFETLLAAANAAGLVDALSGNGPLTVFAPTDEAFSKLPDGTLSSLLLPENKAKLASILKYHVVSGRIYSDDAVAAGTATTLEGSSVRISVDGDVGRVNGAKLLSTDIDASNGVIHVIDSVLLPPTNRQSSVSPRRMIELAIEQGAPMYNSGHASQCASVYMNTVTGLLSSDQSLMSTSTRQVLQSALTNANQTTCPNTQAWALRHALDHAYTSMANIH